MVPLGYEVKNRKVVIVKEEAERVRSIFRRYLELGSLSLLMQDLRQRKILTKIRKLSTGKTVGGNPLTRGPLAHLLRNRFYIGEVAFKGELLPGEQPAILDRKLFEAVQRKLDKQRTSHKITRSSSESVLIGRIFDDRGNRMTPSRAQKNGKRYRYYLCSALSQGRAELAGSVRRIPAPEVEILVIDAVRKRLKEDAPTADSDLINLNVGRVEVHADKIVIKLARKGDRESNQKADKTVLYVPWKKTNQKRRREIIALLPLPQGQSVFRPILLIEIGIGARRLVLRVPCHTTRHADPHRAV